MTYKDKEKNFTWNSITLKNWLACIQNIYGIRKKLIIFLMSLIINKILRLFIFFIIMVHFIKIHISYNGNSTALRIIYLILVDVFIANINTLVRSIIQLFTLFLGYMYLNLTFKNAKMTKVQLLIFEILVCNGGAFVNRAWVP